MLVLITGIFIFLISYAFDEHVNLFFNESRFAFFDVLLSVITNFGFVVVAMLIIPSFILYRKGKNHIFLLWLGFIISFVLNFIAKLIVHRPRPIATFAYPFSDILSYSFPSTHSIVVFSLLPILAKYLPKQKYFWIVFAFLVAFSRIYFGFHFLSDVVFGAFAGYFIGNYLLHLAGKRKS